jgi:selenide,water dikinase
MERGILSSLQPQNTRLRRAIRNLDAVAAHRLYPVLFDPQTAGGRLAGVPQSQASTCLAALSAAGYADAAIIGEVDARSAALEPIIVRLIADAAEAGSGGRSAGRLEEPETAYAHKPVL